MATVTVRNLPDPIHRALRVRAAEHGRSMEAEVRAILERECGVVSNRDESMAPVRRLQAWIDDQYGADKPKNAVDEFIAERRAEAARE